MKKQIINWYNLPARIHSLSLTKQDKLTAGSNIQIEDNLISVTGGGDSAELMIEITHADLLTLVNNSELVAGQQYRITDYVATVDTDFYNPDSGLFYARSNNHAFDIIVTADSVNKLNENARAIRHEGDTYFPSHTKFESWKLKYTIFNDSERFNWAVSEGKGVVYQLIDEFNNDIPYDFKSIQFQPNDVWVYTFGGTTDDSLIGNCNNNTINDMLIENVRYLSSNTFGSNCHSNTLGSGCYFNIFGSNCHSNTLGSGCNFIIFGNDCNLNTFLHDCHSNTFGDGCSSNTFGNYCQINTFRNECQLNTFGNYYMENTFGDNYRFFNIDSNISNKDFTTLLPLFTTPPNMNKITVTKTANGAVMSQVINSTTTESIDI